MVLRTQYQVIGPTPVVGGRATVSAADQESVKEIVKAVAVKMRFEDRTDTSLVPGTLVRYAQPVRENPMTLIAWVNKGNVVVDFMQESPVLGETEAYRGTKETLLLELRRAFGERLVVPAQKDQASGVAARTN